MEWVLEIILKSSNHSVVRQRPCSRGRRVPPPATAPNWMSLGDFLVSLLLTLGLSISGDLAASCGEPNFSHLYEMARLGKFRQFRAHCFECRAPSRGQAKQMALLEAARPWFLSLATRISWYGRQNGNIHSEVFADMD